ncbi:efflux RND transporter periplasmic adaptor subunit [bacterium]|nr:efflux RND transporter periplasmic adaptor subunit [bacterium]
MIVRRETLALVAGMVLILLGCGKRNQFVPPPPAKVTIALPSQADVVETVDFTGTTRAVQTVQIRSRVDGYLKQVGFKDGSNVKIGDLLFVIEPEPFEVALRSAQARVDKSKASLQLADHQLVRTQRLAESNSVAKEEVETRLAERNSAAADVGTAEADVEKARLDLNYTQIHSPINGRIGRRLVDVGNLVQTETTLLSTIESIDPIHAYFSISEGDYLRLAKLHQASSLLDPDAPAFELSLGLPNEEDLPFTGRFDYRDLGVDPETGTLLWRGIFPNPKGQLVPGLYVRLRASLGQPAPKILVEERSIASDQRGTYVLIVNQDSVVEHRPVKLGLVQGQKRVVEEGITENDWVIINGLQRARAGMVVDPSKVDEASKGVKSPVGPVSSPVGGGAKN